mgnify:CR=1 FL=1
MTFQQRLILLVTGLVLLALFPGISLWLLSF